MSLLLTLAWTSVSFGPGPGNKPIVSCESLGTAALGPNVTVISAELVKTAIEASAAGETCTYEDNVDVGDPSTIVAHTPGLVDRKKCCALCFANSECGVAAVLPASYGQNVGCWLKTGAGERAKKPGVTVCRTNRPPPAPPPGTPTSYCLVKVLVQPAINIWVTLPADGSYNDRCVALTKEQEEENRARVCVCVCVCMVVVGVSGGEAAQIIHCVTCHRNPPPLDIPTQVHGSWRRRICWQRQCPEKRRVCRRDN